MPTFKTLISIVEPAEQKMKESSNDDINGVDTVILLPENVDSLTDDEEAQDNHVMIDNGFPSDIFGTNKLFLGGEDNEDEVEDDGNAESGAQDEKEKRVLELMKYVEERKSKPKSWINKYPAKIQLLEPINRDSKSIKHAKVDIVNNLTGKCPHEIFEKYVNAELTLITLQQTLQHPSMYNI